MKSLVPVSLLVAALTLATACDPDALTTESSAEPIIHGTLAINDDAVVMLSMGCTGALIAPTVVLTAAHCMPSGGVHFGLEVGSFFASRDVTEEFVHRSYDAGIGAGDDIALLRLAQAAPEQVAPIPYNTTALDDSLTSAVVRGVGFGLTEDGTSGERRQVYPVVHGVDALFIVTGDATGTFCFGDSGGPMLTEIDGVEQVIGVASFINTTDCTAQTRHSRVDVYTDEMIDEVVQAWSGPCPRDGVCDPDLTCPGFADPDCDPCGLDGWCQSGCDDRDLDCAFGGLPGDICADNEDCESLLCVVAADDARVSYCSMPCDADADAADSGCDPTLRLCARAAGPSGEDVCHYEGITPTTQGAPCLEDEGCRSTLCDPEDHICVEQCGADLPECSVEYSCRALTDQEDACRLPEAGGGCCRTTPRGDQRGSWLLGLLVLAAWRRSQTGQPSLSHSRRRW